LGEGSEMGERIIEKIMNGVSVDHISLGMVWKVAQILHVEGCGERVSLADGCNSMKMPNGKGVLKIENIFPSDGELDLISLVAPRASVSVIRNGLVESKRRVEVPSVLNGLVGCANGNCISQDDQENVVSKIYYIDGKFKCHYCGHFFGNGGIGAQLR
jgi:aspartate carbamoyltransferase regulatory subunit